MPSESGSGPSPSIQPQLPSPSSRADFEDSGQPQLRHEHEKPVVTSTIRARIVKALATIKGKRGSPFSFVTSGDSPSFSTKEDTNNEMQRDVSSSWQDSTSVRLQATPVSLKLSRILRPLTNSVNNDDDWRPAGSVTMPSYVSSMTMGQTITDPIAGGIVSPRASNALFEFFMLHMNAKWEYILDPCLDIHDNVQKRSALLFTSILFCASKFCNFIDGEIKPTPDQFLQSRLCSVARNLAIKALAEGDRSIETMQALYLLVCWKDADDDISYLHSGYAFRILHDLDLEHGVCDGRQTARRKRTWLALFRQDRQQSLFFLRRASLSQADDDTSLLGDLDAWLKTPYSLPLDFAGCCSAHIRCIQSRIRHMVQKASMAMLPCLLDLMDTELRSWRLKWTSHLEGEGRARATARADGQSSILPELLYPDREHLATLVAVWENSVRLNVSSAILRQALVASVSSSSLDPTDHRVRAPVNIDLSTVHEVLSPSLPGLASSVESAIETLRQLMRFSVSDLRRAPDAILLLAPNAALFLCLLLCLPGNGILGPAFQRTAVNLIRDIAQHVRLSVQSAQDIVALHSAYLESLVDLLDPSVSSEEQSFAPQSGFDINLGSGETRDDVDFDFSALQYAQALDDGVTRHGYDAEKDDPMLGVTHDPEQNLHMQGLANLLDGYFLWEMPAVSGDMNIG